jgi:hypothetical protein
MTQELRIGTRRFRVTTLWHTSWISMHEHSLLTGTSPNAASSRESTSSAARRRGEHSQEEDQAQDPEGEGKNQEGVGRAIGNRRLKTADAPAMRQVTSSRRQVKSRPPSGADLTTAKAPMTRLPENAVDP